MGYDSTSIYYAIFKKKPIVLITTDEFKNLTKFNNMKYYYIKNLKYLLDIPCINISNTENISNK